MAFASLLFIPCVVVGVAVLALVLVIHALIDVSRQVLKQWVMKSYVPWKSTIGIGKAGRDDQKVSAVVEHTLTFLAKPEESRFAYNFKPPRFPRPPRESLTSCAELYVLSGRRLRASMIWLLAPCCWAN